MEFAWLDGWLCDLRDAVERSILKEKPNIPADRLAELSKVDDLWSGRYHGVSVGGELRFAVRLTDGVILGVEGGAIRFGRPFGKIGEWEQWDWKTCPTRRVQEQASPLTEIGSMADDDKTPTGAEPPKEATADDAKRERQERKFGWGPGDVIVEYKDNTKNPAAPARQEGPGSPGKPTD